MTTLEEQFRKAGIYENKDLVITSTVFGQGKPIPSRYTCDGENVSPPLQISGVPEGTRTLAIIMEDPDAPVRPWIHWVAWNIPPVAQLEENYRTAVQGQNDFSKHVYCGPCPPGGEHRYFFRAYAIDRALEIPPKLAGKAELEKAMSGHILAWGELMGKYRRKEGRDSD